MGNQVQVVIDCPACEGRGRVNHGSVLGRAAVGAVVGSALGGPVGTVIGALAGAGSAYRECVRCSGTGKTAVSADNNPSSSRKSAHTPGGWHGYGGKTMTMYHGTSEARARAILQGGFKPSSGGMLGAGVYVSADLAKARKYGDTILDLEVKLGKIKRIDSQGHPMRTSWNSHGYDSAWVPAACGMVHSGLTETCVFNPKRIRVVSVQWP
mmetsp:Transcript_33443/g.93841  ORF Transcript_33443/g.93841 Transcript_33443/m.93841 type:complete len:210 (+) Transcript_33443:78-707(+)